MKPYHRILHDVVNLPTAPFVETHVIAYIRDFVSKRRALRLSTDRFGNLLVTYTPRRRRTAGRARRGRQSTLRPVLFAAHMDHPGFVATQMIDARRVRADFRGWVQAPYFQNAVIQFFSGGRWIRARIAEVIPHRPKKSASSARSFGADAPPEAVIARVREPVGVGSPGMWALGDAVVRDNRLHARACDDVAGLSAILCMLDAICRKPTAVPCYAFFTRAEEVGFGGALAAVSDRTVPRSATVVAVECSKAIAGVAMGDGPILRVGDKASIFTPAATGWCQVVAERLAARDSSFAYQRKLMDGGTCESTAYCHYGYQATGVCLALGNYHNMDTDRKKVGPEFIDIRDFDNLVKWFVALAAAPAEIPYEGVHPGLDARLTTLLKEHRPRLLKSARSVARAGA